MDLKSLQTDFTRFVARVKGKAAVLQKQAAALLCWKDGVQDFDFSCQGDPEHLYNDEQSKPPGQTQPPQNAPSSSRDSSKCQPPQTSVTQLNCDNPILHLLGGDDSSAYTFGNVGESASACQSPNQLSERAVDPSFDLSPLESAVSRSCYCTEIHTAVGELFELVRKKQVPTPERRRQSSVIGTLNNHGERSSIGSGSTLMLPNPDHHIQGQEVKEIPAARVTLYGIMALWSRVHDEELHMTLSVQVTRMECMDAALLSFTTEEVGSLALYACNECNCDPRSFPNDPGVVDIPLFLLGNLQAYLEQNPGIKSKVDAELRQVFQIPD
ncbi:hypothetical protein BDW67DRAFT_183893 [Aspergillus spinulosporus]